MVTGTITFTYEKFITKLNVYNFNKGFEKKVLFFCNITLSNFELKKKNSQNKIIKSSYIYMYLISVYFQ